MYIKVADEMAYSADPDQNASKGAFRSGSTLLTIPLSILRNNYIKSKIYTKKYGIVFESLGHLP